MPYTGERRIPSVTLAPAEELVTIPPWQAKYKLNLNAAKARETVAR